MSGPLDLCPELKDHSPKSFQLPGGIIDQHSLPPPHPTQLPPRLQHLSDIDNSSRILLHCVMTYNGPIRQLWRQTDDTVRRRDGTQGRRDAHSFFSVLVVVVVCVFLFCSVFQVTFLLITAHQQSFFFSYFTNNLRGIFNKNKRCVFSCVSDHLLHRALHQMEIDTAQII